MDKGYFHSEPDEREPFSIVIPPPNVTGILHMGHMLNNTIQDLLIRKARLEGKNACWVPGTDHASIATEAKVVRWLREEKGLRKSDITREEFINYAWQWTEKYGGLIMQQLQRLGASCDWERTAFTMDEIRSAILAGDTSAREYATMPLPDSYRGVTVQPAEFAKLALLLFSADVLTRKARLLGDVRHMLVPVLPLALLLAALVMLEPDLGTTLLLCAIAFGLLFVAGTPLLLLGGIGTLGLSAGMALTRPFARSTEQGADTLVWLVESADVAEQSGGYYVDRKRRAPTQA